MIKNFDIIKTGRELEDFYLNEIKDCNDLEEALEALRKIPAVKGARKRIASDIIEINHQSDVPNVYLRDISFESSNDYKKNDLILYKEGIMPKNGIIYKVGIIEHVGDKKNCEGKTLRYGVVDGFDKTQIGMDFCKIIRKLTECEIDKFNTLHNEFKKFHNKLADSIKV